MQRSKSLIIFLLLVPLICIDGVLARSAAFGQESATDQSKQLLIERFRAKAKTDHKAAYEAAQEFLQTYPGDTSDDGQYIKRWMAAYEKVELNGVKGTSESLRRPVTDSSGNKTASSSGGPTLADTVLFVKEQMETYSTYFLFFKDRPPDKQQTDTHKIADYQDCNLSTVFEKSSPYGKKYLGRHDTYRITVKFSTIDPQRIKVVKNDLYAPDGQTGKSVWRVELPAINDEKLISVKFEVYFTDKDGPGPTKQQDVLWSKLDISFVSEDVANRVAKALRHAVEMCKSKPSPF